MIDTLRISDEHENAWEDYVRKHPDANPYHAIEWKNVIRKVYGHRPYYTIARRDDAGMPIVGILPLFHMKHFLFGNKLVSTPFFDHGGILADDSEVEKALLREAVKIAYEVGAEEIQMRHLNALSWLDNNRHESNGNDLKHADLSYPVKDVDIDEGLTIAHRLQTQKVRMVLELPENPDTLFKSFKSKLRSQIRRPIKEGLTVQVGGMELIDDFYRVFSINMRDLGSPVHKKGMIANVIDAFGDKTRLFIIYKGSEPIACSLVFGFKNVLANPWASALRKFKKFSANMLLYWEMLSYGCENGFKYFDFGRSSYGEGTYRFKEQWGAVSQPMYWHHIYLNKMHHVNTSDSKQKFSKIVSVWQRLPMPIANIVGPHIRRNIDL